MLRCDPKIIRPDGSRTLHLFGRMEQIVTKLQSTLGLTAQQIFDFSLKSAGDILNVFTTGRKLLVLNEDGTLRHEFSEFEELLRHIEREQELEGDDSKP
jgi:hypothetical protein